MKKTIFLLTLLANFPVYADVFMLPEAKDVLYESAYPLNEYLISTQDKKCTFHYLSKTAPADNVKIVVKNISYPEKCLGKGSATVQIVNNLNAVLDTFDGFFIDGFFIGNLPLNSYILKRSSDENGTQYLNFFIDEDKELKIRYIGKMKSVLKEGAYTSFDACSPFEITLQTNNKSLFSDKETLKNLITIIKTYARTICPTVQVINVNASDSPSLTEDATFFRLQLIFDHENKEWFLKNSTTSGLEEKNQQEKKATSLKNAIQLLEKSQETGNAEQGDFIIHISAKTNEKVVYVDLPFIMKSIQNKHHLKEGWYQVSGSIHTMDDFERKRSGISLNEKAALLEIEDFKSCSDALCHN